jgi:hypothetical protein
LKAFITHSFETMTSEKKAALIRNAIILLLAIGIPGMVFYPSKEKPREKKEKAAANAVQTDHQAEGGVVEITHFNDSSKLKDGQITEIIAEATKKRGGIVVGIIHLHVPGNAASEQTADNLNRIARRYGKQVKLIRVNITACPKVANEERVTSPPKVVMTAGTQRACEFDGRSLWMYPQIERKVDELLHGLERVGKDWRPTVKGMQPMSGSAPLPPGKPAGP